MRNSRVAVLLVSFMVLGSASCASFRAGQVQPVSDWPPQTSAKKSIRLITTYDYMLNGKPMEGAALAIDTQAQRVADVYVDSGMFSQVIRDRGETDLVGRVKMEQEEDGSMALAFITGLTLYLVPSKSDVTVRVKTTFADADGNDLGTFEKAEKIAVWQQLFLVFVAPFKFPVSVYTDTIRDLNRATIADAHAAGVI